MTEPAARKRRSLATVFRSERYSAISLLGAAILGLALANSVAGPGLIALMNQHIVIPGTTFDLSVEHWITDGLLAIFFFIIAGLIGTAIFIGTVILVVRLVLSGASH